MFLNVHLGKIFQRREKAHVPLSNDRYWFVSPKEVLVETNAENKGIGFR